jgi:2-amino-4-hydroxy-6-hydroxymethyldihydropteridine diphosphokinase
MEKGIFLLLGSNLGDLLLNLELARSKISTSIGAILTASSIYRTAPWGITNQPNFLNQVVITNAVLDPFEILHRINQIEREIGRIREIKWGSRVIDIDILFYHQRVIHATGLDVPHPGIPFRRFTLEPLAEIAPDFVHPEFQKSILTLKSECDDLSPVERVSL